MDSGLYLIFLATTVMLIMVPGPSAITAASQGASHPQGKAFFGVLGIACADVLYFSLSATGIASLIIASATLFALIKWVGVAYLFYLGLSAIFSDAGPINLSREQKVSRPGKLFYQGLIVQLANPKALLYFSALLPQFIDPAEPVLLQLLIMGASCLLADLLVYSTFSYMGNHLARKQLKARVVNAINKTAGLTLIATGIRIAMMEAKS